MQQVIKNFFLDEKDILPIFLLITSISTVNLGVLLFNAYALLVLLFLTLFHILIIFKMKYSQSISISQTIKYALYILCFNSLSVILILKLMQLSTKQIINLTIYNFKCVAIQYIFASLLILWGLEKLSKINKNKKKVTINKHMPLIMTCVCAIGILEFFLLDKNLLGALISILTVVPYAWYVFTLAVKSKLA